MKKCICFITAIVMLSCALCLVLAGCGQDETPKELPIQVGTVHKTYALYEPVSTLENIDCDLYYHFPNSGHGHLGEKTVDTWNTYKLEERENGPFSFDITTKIKDGYDDEIYTAKYPYILCDRALSCNFSDLSSHDFNYYHRSIDADHYDSEYFSLVLVDDVTFLHNGSYPQYSRTWWVRLYVVFEEDDTRLTMHEYSFHVEYFCEHDDNDNEIFTYTTRDVNSGEIHYGTTLDKWLYDLYQAQHPGTPLFN